MNIHNVNLAKTTINEAAQNLALVQLLITAKTNPEEVKTAAGRIIVVGRCLADHEANYGMSIEESFGTERVNVVNLILDIFTLLTEVAEG